MGCLVFGWGAGGEVIHRSSPMSGAGRSPVSGVGCPV